ncbi:hypothetical protein ZIOFF_032053 [Zingiber officinale]|uniref:Uncharacterized protein n=1 Tax=Zingiber officinale TaxID=94328 RepID=A0A8J5GG30_ZINOF|nr:hypothetical protein ZIOFF_032053 [Zingiber officinale]
MNKRKQKLIQNIRGQELRDNDLQDEHESHDITSNSQLDTQNGGLELDQNEEFTEEMLKSQRQQNRHGRTVMRDVHALDPNDVLVVQFNERGQSYGDIQPLLANFVVPQKLTPEVWEAQCHYWNTNEALLDEAVRRRLQDKSEGTQPTEVHEDAFRL